MEYAIPEYITNQEIKNIREKLNMSQSEFADFIKVSKSTIERWESSPNKITGPIILLIQILESHEEYLDEISIPKKEAPLRMYYMYKNKLCTLIDVDTLNQKIKIKNYTNNLIFRAFGINNHPNFQNYENFLKERCFPKSRDKLKILLKSLNLPFYDPLMIIKKTEGRMAEDDFWIKIEE